MKLQIPLIILLLTSNLTSKIIKLPKSTKTRKLRDTQAHIYSNPMALDLLVASTLIYFLIGCHSEWALVLFSLPFILQLTNEIIVKKFRHGDGRNLKSEKRSLQRYIKKIYRNKEMDIDNEKKEVVSFLRIHHFQGKKVGPEKLASIVGKYFLEMKGIRNRSLTRNIKSVVGQIYKKKKLLMKLAEEFIH